MTGNVFPVAHFAQTPRASWKALASMFDPYIQGGKSKLRPRSGLIVAGNPERLRLQAAILLQPSGRTKDSGIIESILENEY